MSTRRSAQLTIGFSPVWKKQSAWDVPRPGSDLTKAFPATSRNYINVADTTEDVLDCTGEDFLFEIITGQTATLTIDFDVDPDLLAGMMAFAKGVAQAPSGGTNEVQTETVTATGGTRRLVVQVGANAQTTADIAFNADEATIQAALEALSNVAPNDIVVTAGGGAGEFVYTFGGAFGKQQVNMIGVQTHLLTGGTSVFAETTPGSGLEHAISRVVAYSLPLMTLHVGFRGSDKQPVIFKNVVVNSVRVRASSREKVTCTVELIGSAELNFATGYTMPACMDIVPIRFGDCALFVGGTDYISGNLCREFEYFFQNDVNPQFDGAGIYATRHERADVRPSGLNYFVLGEPGDSLFNLAKAKTTLEHALRIGPVGRNVQVNIPQGYLKLAPEQIRFGGDPPESEIALTTRFRKVSGDSTTPLTVIARTAQTATYLSAV